MKRRRELGPLRDAEVLPFRELLLEREQLLRGERRPRLPVRLVFPQVALDLGRLAVLCNRKRVPLEDHPSFIATHEPDREPTSGVGAAKPVFQRVGTVGHPEPNPVSSQTATSCFCRGPGSGPAPPGQRLFLFFSFFFPRGRGEGVQFIIFPPERRRKLASLPFCQPTAGFRPRIAPR